MCICRNYTVDFKYSVTFDISLLLFSHCLYFCLSVLLLIILENKFQIGDPMTFILLLAFDGQSYLIKNPLLIKRISLVSLYKFRELAFVAVWLEIFLLMQLNLHIIHFNNNLCVFINIHIILYS